jgi:hypothetical protein
MMEAEPRLSVDVTTVPPPSAALLAIVQNDGPAQARQPKRQSMIVLALLSAFASTITVVMRMRPDWVELPAAWQFGMAGLWLAGAAFPLWFLLVPKPGRVTARWRLAMLLGGSAWLGAALLAGWFHPAGPSSFDFSHRPLSGHACAEMGLVLALPPALLMALLLRGVYPTSSRWAAVAIGVTAGNLSGLLLHFHCRIADPVHLVLFHGGAVVLAATVAGFLAPYIMDRPWAITQVGKPTI